MRQRGHISQWVAVLTILLSMHADALAVRRPRNRLAVAEIRQLEAEWRSAQLAGDVLAMDRLLSEDFLGITAAGQVVTKAQQLERMRARQLVLKEMKVEDTKIKLVGSIAIVTSLAAVDGTAEGKPMHGDFRYTRVYQRLVGGAWKITSFEATRIPKGTDLVAGKL